MLRAFERFAISFAGDDQVGAVRANASDLGADETTGTKIFAGNAEFHCGERHRGAVISSRRGNHAGFRNFAQQQIRERAARFERTRVLQQFQLECEAYAGKSEVRTVRFDHRRAADVPGDRPGGDFDAGPIDGVRIR